MLNKIPYYLASILLDILGIQVEWKIKIISNATTREKPGVALIFYVFIFKGLQFFSVYIISDIVPALPLLQSNILFLIIAHSNIVFIFHKALNISTVSFLNLFQYEV